MRLLIAIGLFLLSLAFLLVGIAQRTVWAPPASYKMAVNYEAANPFVVIPKATLELYPGEPTVSVEGPRGVFLATARENDIVAWVGASPHTLITSQEDSDKLEATSMPGAGSGYSPVGSDLWRSSTSEQKSAKLKVSPVNGEAMFVASDGASAAPGSITLVWPNKFDLSTSNLLLGIGFGLLVIALILNLIHYQSMRKRRGPRRRVPKAPQGPKLRIGKQPRMAPPRGRRAARKVIFALPVSALVLAMATGCAQMTPGPNATPTPTATAVISDPPVVTAAQLQRILSEVAKVAKDGDAQSKGALLSSRLAGPALQQRTAYYTLRKLDKKLKALPAIAGKPITFSLPAASSLWPRAIMAVTDEEGTPSPQMLVLVQETPRSQYQLWYNIRLMQGASIPLVPVADIGAIPVAADAQFLKAVPSELPSIYGSIIDNGAGIAGAERFALTNDEFFKQISQSQDAQVAALKNGKITFTHALGSPKVVSLATADGGALVALSMIDGYTIRPTKRGSAITVTGLEKTLLGASGSPTGVVSKYSDMLLFYVPQTGSDDRIRLLGVTQGLLSIRSR
jgi:hypothetical protein